MRGVESLKHSSVTIFEIFVMSEAEEAAGVFGQCARMVPQS